MRFSKEHEWVKLEGSDAKVGITNFAQLELGEIVFVDLPNIGDNFKVGDEIAVIESVKAASEIYAPVSGEIIEVNSILLDSPQLINEQPYEAGWIFKLALISIDAVNDLMDEDSYQSYINSKN
ncbi:MAG: glycine cleavage system protein GcvH [Dehalococcoidia bacterium]|jgi:glycine cleavage system H protein|nr:glycine cleavage system protein GcvH [Dehalococcoidia bacterium]